MVQGVVQQAQQAAEFAAEEVPIRRYVVLFQPVRDALLSITGNDFPSHRLWTAWWDEHKDNFEVQETP